MADVEVVDAPRQVAHVTCYFYRFGAFAQFECYAFLAHRTVFGQTEEEVPDPPMIDTLQKKSPALAPGGLRRLKQCHICFVPVHWSLGVLRLRNLPEQRAKLCLIPDQ
jgi:hypothetical protein